MKRKYYILGTLALLCLLGTGYYAWTLYDAHCKQVAEWNEGAKAAFEEALWLDVNKRAEVPIYSSSSGEHGMTTLKERVPDSVFVTSALGRKGYRIERYKYENSLIKERMRRGQLGVLLEKYPLSIDTLSVLWNSILLEKEITNKAGEKATTQEAISVSLIKKAMSGDVRAFEVIRDTIGEKPTDKIDATNTNIDITDQKVIENVINKIKDL